MAIRDDAGRKDKWATRGLLRANQNAETLWR